MTVISLTKERILVVGKSDTIPTGDVLKEKYSTTIALIICQELNVQLPVPGNILNTYAFQVQLGSDRMMM